MTVGKKLQPLRMTLLRNFYSELLFEMCVATDD